MYWLYKFGSYEIPRPGVNPENFQITAKNPEMNLFNGSADLYGSDRTGINENSLTI